MSSFLKTEAQRAVTPVVFQKSLATNFATFIHEHSNTTISTLFYGFEQVLPSFTILVHRLHTDFVKCKTQIFHRRFEGNLSITYSDRSR